MFVHLKFSFRRGALVAVPLFIVCIALLAPRAGTWLVVADSLDKSDAIIVLGGTMYERPLEAIDLRNEGWAPRIYLFREIADWGEVELLKRGVAYTRSVDVQIDAMVRLGVPRDAIGILDQANSTAEESTHVRQLVTRHGYSRVIIVTSKQHTRRARLVMRRRLDGTGAQVIVRPSRYDLSPVDRWWENRSTLRFTIFETQRLLGYWIGLAD
jgi:uncharacterized SAM-binding protein YcdF (DUF218 family)